MSNENSTHGHNEEGAEGSQPMPSGETNADASWDAVDDGTATTSTGSAAPNTSPPNLRNPAERPRATTVADLAIEAGVECFRDQYGHDCAWVPVEQPSPHRECLRLESKDFLGRFDQIVQAKRGPINTTTLHSLRQAASKLQLVALRSGRRDLHVRLACEAGSILVDVGDANWQMIEITRDGWSVKPQDAPRFFRPAHLEPLSIPTAGGEVQELFDFTPVASGRDRILLLAWLLSAFHAGLSSPILLLTGTQGSGKTTRSRWLRSLVDSSKIPVLGELEKRQLTQTFYHHAVLCWENVSTFSPAIADYFCRAVILPSLVKFHKLYTDEEPAEGEKVDSLVQNTL